MTSPTIAVVSQNDVTSPATMGGLTYTGPGTILVFPTTPTGAGTVTASGLTFNLVASIAVSGGSFNHVLECWAAPDNTSGSHTVTITVGAAGVHTEAAAFAITNVYDITSAFDSNATLPATGSRGASAGTYTVPSTGAFSTTQADDLLLLVASCYATGATSTPTGYTVVLGTGFLGASVQLVAWTKSVSAVQTGQTISLTATGDSANAILVALTADAKAIALQTFVTTICT